ncbi:hypothetical protein ACKZDW_09075 [Ralstonia syzygii subsp. celebesensis]|uniref:Uncharacterized protein n=2 Tax=Ralstonia syzygii subsp. celebesensis TaxID=1310168 RepID=A0A1U9VE94_9RALS|nr:hypothetical protein [Ralstonia syzygii]AQW28825.1 hypothetical protein B0B51_01525 [blood disease bacterium A2-HR MARDI]QQV54627.1 hypothetical protein JK151_10615 [Ralstonia syzygii subsp. celebesensis]CCA79072.1 hypothetical protein BDB_40025 [blood disease bacterium R229]
MDLGLDDQSIELACPKCAHKFNETIGRLKNNPDITCGGCGATIHISADELRKTLEEVERSLEELRRQLRNFSL